MAIHYVDLVTGTDTPTISQSLVLNVKSINAATKANPCNITFTASHGFLTGDKVHITLVAGMTQLNNNTYTVTVVDPTNITIGVDSTGYTTYTSGGQGAIHGASKTNPCVIHTAAHGLTVGQVITPSSVGGMTQLNGNNYTVTSIVNADSFEINVDASAFTLYTSGGTITGWNRVITSATQANPCVITAPNHGFSNGQKVVIQNVVGMVELNEKVFTVANAATNTFELSGINSTGFTAYSSGGTVRRMLLTINQAHTNVVNGEEIKVGKTFTIDASIQAGSGTITFTRNSNSVSTSASLVGVVAAGDFIGLTTATGKGWDTGTFPVRPDIYYKVVSINASAITLETKYMGTTSAVGTINRLRYNTEIRPTGNVLQNAVTISKNDLTISGGWNLDGGAAVRDGETWFGPQTRNGDYRCISLSGTGNTIKYFGLVEGYRNIASAGTNTLVEYCFLNPISYWGAEITDTNGLYRYCTGNSLRGSYQVFSCAGTSTVTYCYAIHNTAGGAGFLTSSVNTLISNSLAEGCILGYSISNNSRIYNCTGNSCTTGASVGANAEIDTCVFDLCNTGVSTPGSVDGPIIKSTTISNSTTYGISLAQVFSSLIEGCTFSGNSRDIYADQYVNLAKIINCSTSAPTVYFYDHVLNTTTTLISECTIDAPSIAKAFSIISGANYMTPQVVLQNSFTLPSGQYFSQGTYAEDAATFRTTAPSMRLAFNTTVSNQRTSIKIVSSYVVGNVGKTVTWYMKRDAPAWTGSITPVLKLNGKLIKTETAITSLSTSWTQYTASASAGQITGDGELSLEFICNMNNTAFWIDDTVVS